MMWVECAGDADETAAATGPVADEADVSEGASECVDEPTGRWQCRRSAELAEFLPQHAQQVEHANARHERSIPTDDS